LRLALIWLCADIRAQARPVIMLADHANSPAMMTTCRNDS
jgi:hypothetical protein